MSKNPHTSPFRYRLVYVLTCSLTFVFLLCKRLHYWLSASDLQRPLVALPCVCVCVCVCVHVRVGGKWVCGRVWYICVYKCMCGGEVCACAYVWGACGCVDECVCGVYKWVYVHVRVCTCVHGLCANTH